MPRRNSWTRRFLHHLFVLSFASSMLAAVGRVRNRRAWDEWDENWTWKDEPAAEPPPAPAPPQSRRRRLAATLTFATLFFAGAALSAGAGDQVRSLLERDGDSTAAAVDPSATDTNAETTTDQTTTTTETTAPQTPEQPPATTETTAPPADSSDPASTGQDDGDGPVGPNETAPHVAPSPGDESAAPSPADGMDTAGPAATPRRHAKVHRHKAHRRLKPQAPEIEGAGAVVWLNRALPDPTPPSSRLQLAFANELVATSRHAHVDWAFVLGVLRARGSFGSVPASVRGLRSVEARLSAAGAKGNMWAAALAFSGQMSFADRAVALAHLYRAIGLDALVQGLVAQRYALANRVLSDRRVSIYAGGEGDIASGRVNVRVLALIEYLADTFGQVTVSCLITGHRLYARPGVISAHIYGLAADISSVGGTPILGHQQPGGVTERAVRAILLLPPEFLPRQVISLLGLGGPSFPLANHYNHIHVGY